MPIKILEHNVKNSFGKVKVDLYNLNKKIEQVQEQNKKLFENQKVLLSRITELEHLAVPLPPKKYIGAKTTKVLHDANCRDVKNITPENRITFSSINDALDFGYITADCVK